MNWRLWACVASVGAFCLAGGCSQNKADSPDSKDAQAASGGAQSGAPPPGGYGVPPPGGYGAPPPGGSGGAPQGGYGAPQTPPQGGYGAPQSPQGGYGAPAQGGNAPGQGGYGAPQAGGPPAGQGGYPPPPPPPGGGYPGGQGGNPPPGGGGYPPAGGQGGYPSAGGGGYPPPASGYGQPQGAANLDAMMAMERQDYGVPPTPELHNGEMHGPTPASIPGGQVITTKGLVSLLQGGQAPALVLDILGGQESIPGSQYAAPASQPGTFNDQTQQQFGQFLQQATHGRKDYPIVLYCLSTQCWMSYNASLRAIHLGYTNVLWYRGGIEAWKQGGQPVQTR